MRHDHARMPRDDDPVFNEVANLTMKVARPLMWHDVRGSWPKRLLGGSCFILRFDVGLIGVTAEHVITAFEAEKEKRGSAIGCFLRTVPFDLTGAIVDRDDELDIATFSITEDQLIKSEATEIDCRPEWPPPTPDKGRELSLAGFPDELKKESSCPIEFRAYASLPRVEDAPTELATDRLNASSWLGSKHHDIWKANIIIAREAEKLSHLSDNLSELEAA